MLANSVFGDDFIKGDYLSDQKRVPGKLQQIRNKCKKVILRQSDHRYRCNTFVEWANL